MSDDQQTIEKIRSVLDDDNLDNKTKLVQISNLTKKMLSSESDIEDNEESDIEDDEESGTKINSISQRGSVVTTRVSKIETYKIDEKCSEKDNFCEKVQKICDKYAKPNSEKKEVIVNVYNMFHECMTPHFDCRAALHGIEVNIEIMIGDMVLAFSAEGQFGCDGYYKGDIARGTVRVDEIEETYGFYPDFEKDGSAFYNKLKANKKYKKHCDMIREVFDVINKITNDLQYY